MGGACALGVSGGATGLAAGSLVGGLLGVVPAVFTLGLSIPVGAVIGGGTGLAVGSSVGVMGGALSGGAAGYGAYKRKDDIQEMRSRAVSRVSSGFEDQDDQVLRTFGVSGSLAIQSVYSFLLFFEKRIQVIGSP